MDRLRPRIPREMPLLPPKLNNDAVRVVYEALLAGRRFTADYRSREAIADEIESYEVNRLGRVAAACYISSVRSGATKMSANSFCTA